MAKTSPAVEASSEWLKGTKEQEDRKKACGFRWYEPGTPQRCFSCAQWNIGRTTVDSHGRCRSRCIMHQFTVAPSTLCDDYEADPSVKDWPERKANADELPSLFGVPDESDSRGHRRRK